jgi:hypothetical protein
MFKPMIEMVLNERPLPSARQRTTTWLRWYWAIACEVPVSNVSVVYNDTEESTTVHIMCECPGRHVLTMTSWATSDDVDHIFLDSNNVRYRVPFEPLAGVN